MGKLIDAGINVPVVQHPYQVVDTDEDGNMIDHPNHYTIGIEVRNFIESWKMDFPTGNVIKYVTRHPYKGKPLEDLKKARNYIDFLIKRYEKS